MDVFLVFLMTEQLLLEIRGGRRERHQMPIVIQHCFWSHDGKKNIEYSTSTLFESSLTKEHFGNKKWMPGQSSAVPTSLLLIAHLDTHISQTSKPNTIITTVEQICWYSIQKCQHAIGLFRINLRSEKQIESNNPICTRGIIHLLLRCHILQINW